LLESRQERGGRQSLDPRGSQLDGQGQPVEAAADGGHRGGVFLRQREVGLDRLGEIDEEGYGRHLSQLLEWGKTIRRR
jgi:hypothetical protein